jgi:hypothetical protein
MPICHHRRRGQARKQKGPAVCRALKVLGEFQACAASLESAPVYAAEVIFKLPFCYLQT